MALIIKNTNVNIQGTNFIAQPIYKTLYKGTALYLDVNIPASYPPPQTGTVWYDLSAARRDATLAGSPVKPGYAVTGSIASMNWLTTGNLEQSNGSNAMKGTIPGNFLPGNMTIQLWMQTDQAGRAPGSAVGEVKCMLPFLTCTTNQVTRKEWAFGLDQLGRLQYATDYTPPGSTDFFGTSVETSQTLNDNKWYNVAVTRTSQNGATTIYINGVSVKTGTLGTTTGNIQFNVSADTIIGNYNQVTTARRFQGNMNEILAYQYVLTAAQIWHNFSATRQIYGV